MRETIPLTFTSIVPDRAAVLALQDMRPGQPVADRVARLYVRALELLERASEPVALLADVSSAEFAEVYAGEGRNAPDSPLARILPRAERLALFALTLGGRISEEIDRRFAARDFALAAMLDAAASSAAEKAVGEIEHTLGARVRADVAVGRPAAVLAYSPGYCGWDVTGQRALFAYLHPEEIGIRLNESCLMEPLKSVSGVVVAGPIEVHDFPADFEFCRVCLGHECRERVSRARAARLPSDDGG
jgi:hypothetical protein